MPLDDPINPASTATERQIADLEKKIDDLKAEYLLFFNGETKLPPEKKREDLEKAVRILIYGGAKTARMDMIIQNVASRFNLYNNLWLKKLNELECGTPLTQKKKNQRPAPPPPQAPRVSKEQQEVYLTLNDEETFDHMADIYQDLLPGGGLSKIEKDKFIDNMKAMMLTNNLVEARVTFTRQKGKLSIKIKK